MIKKILIRVSLGVAILYALMSFILSIGLVLYAIDGAKDRVAILGKNYELSHVYNSYSVFQKDETDSVFDNVIGFEEQANKVYLINSSEMMVIHLDDDTHYLKSLSEVNEQELAIIKRIQNNPLWKQSS